MGANGATVTAPRAQREIAPTITVIIGLALLYFATGISGLRLAHVQQNATLIWAPTGLSLAALLIYGRRAAPGVFAGALAVNLWVETSAATSAIIATGNTLEALAGAWLLQRVARFDPGFARLRDVLNFLLYGVVSCTIISPTLGVGALWIAGEVLPTELLEVWVLWWLGDAGGAIVIAPVLLVGLRGSPPWARLLRRSEAWFAWALLLLFLSVAFGGYAKTAWAALVVALLVFPLLVWAGVRLGPRGAIVSAFITALIAVVGTGRGTGPFALPEVGPSLLLLWAYATTMGATAMILAATVAEREVADVARQAGERQRTELEAQVQHVQRLESLGVLAGGIAHDFNNLLAAIRGNAELARLSGGRPEDVDDSLAAIEVATDRAAELCDQLLTYAGRNLPAKKRVELGPLVSEMNRLLRASVSRRIQFRMSFDGGVPAVFVDAAQLRQVVMNLIVNAAEAIGDRAGTIELRTGVGDFDRDYLTGEHLHADVPPGRYSYLEVSDDGAGMDPETLDKLFDPFFSTKFKGRGLGMAAVLGIVQSHGGAIKVKSKLGEGSVFRVLLPPLKAGVLDRSIDVLPSLDSGPAGLALVADDEEHVLTVVARTLDVAGWDVVRAADGEYALQQFEKYGDEIDVVVLDITMPRMSGLEALEVMRAKRPDLPAIVISGHDAAEIHEASDFEFLRKPFRGEELLDRLAVLFPAGRASRGSGADDDPSAAKVLSLQD